MRFDGRLVLVTGAAGGIGAAAARGFDAAGARVVVSDLAPPSPALGLGHLRFLPADVADEAAAQSMVEEAADGGTIDVLVHAAAVLGPSGPFETVPAAEFARHLAINVMGTVHVAQAATRVMVAHGTRGSIIAFGSVNSLAAERDCAPYACSKGAVRLLVRGMAVDLARYGIRVNAVLPGPVAVPRNAAQFGTQAAREAFRARIPAGRAADPAALVGALLYLADPANDYTTGTDIVVDGGTTAFLGLG